MPRPRTINRNDVALIASVPIRAMTSRSPELSGNFFWLNDKPLIQPRLHVGLDENSLLPISANRGKPTSTLLETAMMLARGSLGFECFPWKAVMMLVILDQSTFSHESAEEFGNLERRMYAPISGLDGPVL